MASVIFPADCAGVWSRQAADRHPRVLFLSPGGSEGTFAVKPSGRTSLAGHAPFRNPSGAFVPPNFGFETEAGLCLRSFSGTSNLPITARHSLHLRFAKLAPKSLRGAFSDAAAGIAVTPIRLNFPVLFQAVTPGGGGRFFPFDKQKLRLFAESYKQKMQGLSTGAKIAGGQVRVACGRILQRENWAPIAPSLRQ